MDTRTLVLMEGRAAVRAARAACLAPLAPGAVRLVQEPALLRPEPPRVGAPP